MSSAFAIAEIAELGVLTQRLTQADSDHRVFGSEHHRYRFRPPLADVEIAAYEKKHGIQLPAAYRCFLGTLGNGGPGPGYGLLRLEEKPRDLSRPFPDVEHFELPEDPRSDDDLVPGALCICHYGCDQYAYLVVTGPAYGNVFDGNAEAEFYRNSISFEAWYREWVETKLRMLDNRSLLDRIHPGMQRHEVESLLSGEWTVYTSEFLQRRMLRHAAVPLEIRLDTDDIVTTVQLNSQL